MTDPLPFTGERFTPECVGELAYEHWHRYAFARRLAPGRRVLDAACGEGYGSRTNLCFEQGDITGLPRLEAGTFDLITCFGVLEHLSLIHI